MILRLYITRRSGEVVASYHEVYKVRLKGVVLARAKLSRIWSTATGTH